MCMWRWRWRWAGGCKWVVLWVASWGGIWGPQGQLAHTQTNSHTHTHRDGGVEEERERTRDRERYPHAGAWKFPQRIKKRTLACSFCSHLCRTNVPGEGRAKKAQNTENPLPCISQGSRQRLSGQSPREKRRATRQQQHPTVATATNMRQLPGEFSFVDGVASQFTTTYL